MHRQQLKIRVIEADELLNLCRDEHNYVFDFSVSPFGLNFDNYSDYPLILDSYAGAKEENQEIHLGTACQSMAEELQIHLSEQLNSCVRDNGEKLVSLCNRYDSEIAPIYEIYPRDFSDVINKGKRKESTKKIRENYAKFMRAKVGVNSSNPLEESWEEWFLEARTILDLQHKLHHQLDIAFQCDKRRTEAEENHEKLMFELKTLPERMRKTQFWGAFAAFLLGFGGKFLYDFLNTKYQWFT